MNPAKTYFKKTFHFDLLAGISVAIVALPLALGFGITTGTGAASGLVTAIVAGFLAAAFGGSNYQVSGPTGAMTVVLVPIVAQYGISSLLYLGLAAGIVVVALGLMKLGRFVERVPWMVMEGFTLGIAIIIALQQLPLVFDVPKGEGTENLVVAIHTISDAFSHPLNVVSLVIVSATLAVKLLWTKYRHFNNVANKIPASAIAVIVITILVKIADLDIHTIGEIPNSFAFVSDFTWPGIPVGGFIYAVFAIAALAAIESLLSARVADAMVHRTHSVTAKHEPNRELIGQGIATVGSALFGGLPATGAIARTSVNVHAGAKTRWAAVIHSVLLLVISLFIGGLVAEIPVAVISGVLLGTSLRIANPESIREILRTTKVEQITFLVTAVSVVAIDLIWGTAIGIATHFVMQKITKQR